ncbi:hypothetical protein PPACK8108_LOCUS6229 [Phakopsora pachyrhizi]|uniref:Ubiquitin carboxyl-terminal hydrolase n=1 Tax=Phakopsora pachyrhizi TaxID=170000 RepID=A0AAV0ASH7_PHAPC|nr:hypothetical protein PPACK8108_LOCUS6229 [Phakopsora pachyrhizi]
MPWLPLESNPDVMNRWSSTLGLDTDRVSFTDVYSLDDDLLSIVPTPVYAVLMLFPISVAYESHREDEEMRLNEIRSTTDPSIIENLESGLVFIKQTIGNACGTIGLLHALSNNPEVPIKENSALKDFIKSCKDTKDPIKRAKLLESNLEISSVHDDLSRSGQSRVPEENEEVNLHFVCFVKSSVSIKSGSSDSKEDRLVELDGRKSFPIDHGRLETDLLHGIIPIVKRFIDLSNNNLQFNLIALSPKIS